MSPRVFLASVLVLFAGSAMAIEEPEFELIEKAGSFELREYAPRIVAETLVSGAFKDASGEGFKRIADYIFGNNVSRSGESRNIEMTAPVSMVPRAEKIGMTAPVNMERTRDEWRVQFFMPRSYTMDTLPRPNRSEVQLRTLPAENFAVHRFSGLVSEDKKKEKIAELLEWLAEKNIEPRGEPVLARYNPPWTLPFLRRNEVMLAY